jgi:hypothetical protein
MSWSCGTVAENCTGNQGSQGVAISNRKPMIQDNPFIFTHPMMVKMLDDQNSDETGDRVDG